MHREISTRMFAATALLGVLLMATACNQNTAPGNDREAGSAPKAPPAQLVGPDMAVSQADRNSIELLTMPPDEAARALGGPTSCSFRMTRVGFPVLVTRTDGAAAVKLNEKLTLLNPAKAVGAAGAKMFGAGEVTVLINPLNKGDAADATLKIGPEMRRDYRGYFSCSR
jgi:hypothetical protein